MIIPPENLGVTKGGEGLDLLVFGDVELCDELGGVEGFETLGIQLSELGNVISFNCKRDGTKEALTKEVESCSVPGL